MIPQEKSAAVSRGLREAFGIAEFEDIRIIRLWENLRQSRYKETVRIVSDRHLSP